MKRHGKKVRQLKEDPSRSNELKMITNVAYGTGT